jgi:PTH1 family peptidyl-tRNA hydrolase
VASDNGVRCIIGLGNPGERYAATRHNAGFWFVDDLARQHGGVFRSEAKFFGDACRVSLGGQDLWLLKPMTYMNRSGQSLSAFARFYKLAPEELLVVHDELDLPPGTARLKKGGGHGGHNGLRDITSALGGGGFLRLRLGVGHPGHKDAVVDYVLNRPSRDEERAISEAVDRAARVVPELMAGEIQRAMNTLHAPDN